MIVHATQLALEEWYNQHVICSRWHKHTLTSKPKLTLCREFWFVRRFNSLFRLCFCLQIYQCLWLLLRFFMFWILSARLICFFSAHQTETLRHTHNERYAKSLLCFSPSLNLVVCCCCCLVFDLRLNDRVNYVKAQQRMPRLILVWLYLMIWSMFAVCCCAACYTV